MGYSDNEDTMNAEHAGGNADGVLLVSAWNEGHGRFLARVTMSGKTGTPTVRVVNSQNDLHLLISEWLESLES